MTKGRKSKVDLEDQKQVFIKYTDILQNDNIQSNDPIFSTISKELDFKMSPLALFLSLKRKHHYFFENVLTGQQATDENHIIKSTSNSSSLSSISFKSNDFDFECSKQKDTKIFSYQIDLYDWKKIQPLYAFQKRTGTSTYKKYRTMPKFKWSNLLKENIYKYTKLPCTWTLKREKVVKNSIFVKGYCFQCTASVEIKSYETTDKIHTIFCKITNINKTIKHDVKKKFKLTPYKRQQIAKMLKYKPAIVVHNELASKVLSDKKDENEVTNTPALPSLSTLRQIKSEARRGQWLDPNPILSLVVMSKSTHKQMIRYLSYHPNFVVYYWSEEQINYYNQYQRKCERITVTIDATGSFFETMRLPDETKITKRLFLYAGLITANTKLKSVPVLQMVTDAHGKQSILDWLNQWKRSVDRSPHEIITDDSSALVAANTEAFTAFSSTKEYIKQMFSVLDGNTLEIPSSFIRLDSSHFTKTVHNLKCFNGVDPHIKYFYIHCIMYLKECVNFETAKEFILDMIKVCLCQYDDELTTASSIYQVALNRLVTRLKTNDFQYSTDFKAEFSSVDVEKLNYETEDRHSTDIDFFIWLGDKISQYQKQLVVIKGTNKNMYFYPPFISEFRRILWKLPLWSNLLCPLFKTSNFAPSSSGIESYFKTLKHLLYKTKLQKYRIDDFINIHCNYLNAEIALARNNLDNDIQDKEAKRSRKKKLSVTKSLTQTKKRKLSKPFKSMKINRLFAAESIFSDRPSFVENWRGEAYNNVTTTKSKLKFVKNGNLCPSVPFDKSSTKLELRNTCCFDSVMYLLSMASIRSISFQETLNTYAEDFIPRYIKLLSDPTSNECHIHILRSEIGVLYFNTKERREKSYCEFACNVSFIFEHVTLKYSYSAIFTKKCRNHSCQFTPVIRQIAFLPLNLNIISVFGIQSLEEATYIAEEQNACTSCDNQTVCKYTVSNTVSFEINLSVKFRVKEIPESLVISSKSYTLMGIIEFIPAISEAGIDHYKCHYPMQDDMYCYDDYDSNCEFRTSTDQPILIHSLTYSEI